MTKIFRNQKVWFCAFLKKLLGIQSPSCRACYGIEYEFDYLQAYRRGLITEYDKRLHDDIMRYFGGSQHD
mgnify:CR=1 FL=1